MATSKEYRDYVIDQSELGDEIMIRPMMGEFLLYYRGKHIGGIYDNCLLVKKTATNAGFGMAEAIPYEGAKALFQVNVDDRDEVRAVILVTFQGLK